MKFRFYAGAPATLAVDVLAVALFEEDVQEPTEAVRALDDSLGGVLLSVVERESFKGRADQSVGIHTHGRIKAAKIVLVGLGARARCGTATIRDFAARIVRGNLRSRRIGLVVPPASSLEKLPHAADGLGEAVAEAIGAGATLGTYRFDKYRTGEKDPIKVTDVALCGLGRQNKRLTARLAIGEAVGEGVALARDLVNEPPITLTPRAFADHARRVARESGLKLTVYGPKEMKRMKMGCILGVAQGSAEEPRLIHLTYTPSKAGKGTPQIALVGKGLTFDSGGLSLKTAKGMEDMKCDMAGGAAVLGAMKAISAVQPSVVVHGIIGSTENMPGGKAIRPGDILRSMNGKTVEVLNTDAEGRLVLADALHYSTTKKVDEIIDLATLTGACMVALGRYTAGFFSNNEEMAARYDQAAKSSGEDAWRLPLIERLRDSLKSSVADLKNIGDTYGGSITAALFLREFVGDTRWVHVDIAGPAFLNGKPTTAGGTGYGVFTLMEYLRDLPAR